jgi:asparagine synthase (glutamine-hydrolysing)
MAAWRVPATSSTSCTSWLRDSVRRHTIGDAPVGTLLSGGVDSSVVTAFAAASAGSAPCPPTRWGSPRNPPHDESAWAELVARHLATDHHGVALTADALAGFPALIASFDEPFAVSSVLGIHAAARAARQRREGVVLTGDGGDELFAGYPRYARPVPGRVASCGGSARGILARIGAKARAWASASRASLEARYHLGKVTLNEAEKRELYAPVWRDGTRGFDTVSWLGSLSAPATGEPPLRWQLRDIQTSLSRRDAGPRSTRARCLAASRRGCRCSTAGSWSSRARCRHG